MSKEIEENKKEKNFLWRAGAVVVFFALSVYVVYLCNRTMLEKSLDLSNSRVNKIISDMKTEIDSLKSDISRLDKQAPAVKTVEVAVDDSRNHLRQKWKAWMELRRKMESNATFEEELKNFHELFSCDQELIDLVDDLAKGVEVITNGNEGQILGACKNMLRKIIRFRKINQRKLVEISGYVLSSIGDCVKER